MTRILILAALAFLLADAATRLALLVQNGHGLAPLLAGVASAYVSLIVAAYAIGAAWHAGRTDACRWNRRRALGTYSHAARTAAARTTPPAELHAPGRHAAAMAAIAAAPLADTLTMPAVQAGTQPMPVIVPPSWGFNGTHVVEGVGRR